MNQDRHELARIAHAFLDPQKKLSDVLPEAQSLRDMLERCANFHIAPDESIASGETRLDSGLAISPTTAAMCIRQLLRTAAFIRGLGTAIGDSMRTDRPVRVLYAGCGPYAVLALPLMSIFPSEQVVFTLLDIHQKCLDDAGRLLGSFGFSGQVDAFVCADAVRYRIPEDKVPDVIVSETMSVALHNEPQVSIARNLLSQAPGARMVPQSICVDAYLLNEAREHVFMPADHNEKIPEPKRDRIHLGNIFELTADSIFTWSNIADKRLPAGKIRIPAPLESRYRPHLLTRIVVYGDNCLQDYDTSLTMPKRLQGQFEGGEELQFHYHLGNHPELRYEANAGQAGHIHRPSTKERAMPSTRYLCLPYSFDVEKLLEDLAKVSDDEWIDHFNTSAYDKDWRCVPLRSVDGDSKHIVSLPGAPYANTAILERCPYFREVIDSFECEKTSIRLMSMGPGSRINPHRDSGTSFEDGITRLHIPILTAQEVLFDIEDEHVHFSAGHTWYLNAGCLHGVRNDSPRPRIHLMMDCITNPWLEKVFMEAGFVAGERPKYGDASINDGNVEAIIANLRAIGTEAGEQLAASLAEIRNSSCHP